MVEEYGILLVQMMENAGRNLADLAVRLLGRNPAGQHIVVYCGNGNNGGGGMVAARQLHNRGASVQAILVGRDPALLKSVPALQWAILGQLGLITKAAAQVPRPDLIVDAMIGYGLSGNPRGAIAEAIGEINDSGRQILSLDAPSGLNTTTGLPSQPCLRASATMTLALPKRGLMQESARPYVGQLFLADIGVPRELYQQIGLDVGLLFAESSIVSVGSYDR